MLKYLITYLTKHFENYIANNFDIFTCTSKEEKKIVDQIYNIKSHVLSNGLELPKNVEPAYDGMRFTSPHRLKKE